MINRAGVVPRPLLVCRRRPTLYRRGLLAYYDYPIATGPLEGTNNKVETMPRQA
jgi:transposase